MESGATCCRRCATPWLGWRAPTPWRRSTWRRPDEVVAARSGSPLVVGVGIGEHFLASDTLALRQVTDRFIYLEEGDVVACSAAGLAIYDSAGEPVQREMKRISSEVEDADLGDFEHYMLKEIYEQPHALPPPSPRPR
jgi:glucosamine--fructose-6-phosphate aminotransferase (isomerizing)